MLKKRLIKVWIVFIISNISLSFAIAQETSVSNTELLKADYYGAAIVMFMQRSASGRITGYEDTISFRHLESGDPLLATQNDEFPYLVLLLAPEHDSISNVRLLVYRPPKDTEQNIERSPLLATQGSSYLRNAERVDRTTAILQMEYGAGYRNELECYGSSVCIYHWFDIGAEQIIEGTIDLLGVTIESERSYPLAFQMTPDGLALLYGRGTVTLADKTVINVGDQDTAEQWLPLLEAEQELARQAAASALGWLGRDASEPDAVVAALISALSDPAWQVRRNAAEALGRLKATSAVDPLKSLLEDKDGDGWVSAVAQEALDLIEKA